MKVFSKILFGTISVLYPILVFLSLVILKVPVKIFSLFVVFIGLVYLLLATSSKSETKKGNWKLLISAGLLLVAGIICLVTGQMLFIKLYPVIMNLIFLFTFGSTLFVKPNICFRFACIGDKSLAGSQKGKAVEKYCYKVTIVWCGFFILNSLAALYTVFFGSDRIWSVYNGGISYFLMGILFAVEFIIRKVVQRKMEENKNISLITTFTAKSRPMDHIVCYDHKWSDKKYLTWNDFLIETAKIRAFIKAQDEKYGNPDKYILHCEDYWHFLCTFVALLQCNKELMITANISPNFIAEIREVSPESKTVSKIRFLTDQKNSDGTPIFDTDFIPDIVKNAAEPSEEEKMCTPVIKAEDTRILVFTSGSTGHPKGIFRTMKEFEADCEYVVTRWYDEWVSRKMCAVVSQHHLYGLMYTISMPFASGCPIRRTRIEYPEELNVLDDDQYMIICVPAFLKRTIAEVTLNDKNAKLPLKNPWIYTSGGAVSPELAVDTEKVFGFCPLEGYGSTETSAIAYRQQSKDGLVWTPIHTAKIWADKDDGCLTVVSPYVPDPKGFKTGDQIEFMEDGVRFLLKGRIDSIVKIEEKRISVTEVENRLMQTGLVFDCCVVPMSDRRQYLAAAVVLNEEGKMKFADTEKYLINRYFHDFLLQYFENVVLPKKWRFIDEIPMDIQGKKKKPVIQKLFAPENIHGIPAETVMLRKEQGQSIEVELEVDIPATSDYFDGHFPDFKLLPAVAQIDLVAHFAQRYFGTKLSCPDVKRFKFSDKILPDTTVIFKMKYDGESSRVTFEILDCTNVKSFSSGSYTVEKE